MATTNTTNQEKIDIVRKQMETTIEQEYIRLIILQSKQQHEFNNKIKAKQVRTTDELNQIKSAISPSEIETQIIVMRREIERGLKDEINTFKGKFELYFKNEKKAFQAQIELLKSENTILNLQLQKLKENTFNITEEADSPKILSVNKTIKNALKSITETQENLKESVNAQRKDSSIISNKIETAEEEIAKNQVKINKHSELEKKIEHTVEELWKLVEGTDTENNCTNSVKKETLLTAKNKHTIFD